MDRSTVVTMLRDNHDIFSGAKIEDFSILEDPNSLVLSTLNARCIRVTPLLSQICDFSFIREVMDDNTIGALYQNTCKSKQDLLTSTLDFIDLCSEYTRLLIKDGCMHPSLNKVRHLSNMLASQYDLMDTFEEIISSDEELQQIIPVEWVDKLVTNFDSLADMVYFDFITRINMGGFKSKRQLLYLFYNYSLEIVNLRGLLDKNNEVGKRTNPKSVTLFEDGLLFSREDGRLYPGFSDTVYEQYDALINVVKVFNQLIANGMLVPQIVQFNVIYDMFQSYRGNYLMTAAAEAKILEKCRKV